MRKLLLFISFASLGFISCNNKDGKDPGKERKSAKSIVGKWEPVDFELKAEGEQLTADQKKLMLESGFYVEFTSSGRYTSSFGEEPETGTYTYDEKTSELTTTQDGGEDVDKSKISWEGNKMIAEDEEGRMVLRKI